MNYNKHLRFQRILVEENSQKTTDFVYFDVVNKLLDGISFHTILLVLAPGISTDFDINVKIYLKAVL